MKIVLCFVAIFFLNVFLFSQQFLGGPGDTKGTAWEIWTKDDLIKLSDSINNSGARTRFVHNKHFRLMANINDTLTQSIGWNSVTCHFNGSGYRITVNITTSNIPPYSVGSVFGSLQGTIDSLIVDGYIINGNAGITGTNSGTISNCINNINIVYTIAEVAAGGIARTNNGTIINCINNGSVSGEGSVGGIAASIGIEGQIISCINTGNITTEGIIKTSAGGIVGFVAGSYAPYPTLISNCINYGFTKGADKVGGILGLMMFNTHNVQIINCINTGVVEGNSNVGAILGQEQ